MQKMEEVSRSKDRILSTLRMKGPCLPVQISKEIEFSPLFAAAFLSELKGEGKVKISNMRVGSSPLYFLPGQENMLEKFSGYLNQREKEAFFLLKEKKVLEDSEQTPVMRVALRAIKDFAHSVNVRVGGESKLFWKHFALDDSEVAGLIRNRSVKPVRPRVEEDVKEKNIDDGGRVKKIEQKVEEKSDKPKSWLDGVSKEVQRVLEAEEKRPLAEKKKAKAQESEFAISVKDYLSSKDIEIVEVFAEKKREIEALIRIDTLLGKQDFYLVAKDKKNVSDNDLAMALQKAQGKKMLAAVFSTGDVNKKGREHLEEWGNLVKWERLGF
ncbi:MAG: hypothetical protein ABIG28_00815 [archaeon]